MPGCLSYVVARTQPIVDVAWVTGGLGQHHQSRCIFVLVIRHEGNAPRIKPMLSSWTRSQSQLRSGELAFHHRSPSNPQI